MKFKILKLLFLLFILPIITLIFLLPGDPAWVECSDEKDLLKYVNQDWRVDKVLKKGDTTITDTGKKLYYKAEDPQIYLSKGEKIKILNFGWRCWFEMGPELNYKKS